MENKSLARFPADCAFIIQFKHPHSASGDSSGRIEHVVSGRARRFADGSQMMAFVAEVLASLPSDALSPDAAALRASPD